MRAMGITCGIGSMLLGARQSGFEIVGNIDWRRYYHLYDKEGRNTFKENFPGAFFLKHFHELSGDQLNDILGIDLVMGHPECGNYSQLNKNRNHDKTNPADIPLFINMIAEIRPRYFVMDDLPELFCAVPMSYYVEKLPDYDLFPEWISNYHYGNVQKNRKRMFMIGALKEEEFVFTPGESDHDRTVSAVIGDIDYRIGFLPNHEPINTTNYTRRGKHMRFRDDQPTWAEVQDYFASKPEGHIFEYHGPDGIILKRPGFRKCHWNAHSGVLTGQNPDIHPLRNLPFTIRERARLQGFPDDFIFYGSVLESDGSWDHDRNNHMVKQTGKAMPIQFCRYVSGIIGASINLQNPVSTNHRKLTPHEKITAAKQWFCENVGYSLPITACDHCWEGRCLRRKS